MNKTPPVFGGLDWNISQDARLTVNSVTNYINIGGSLFEVSVIVFLIVSFCSKHSTLRSPYFIIYTIECAVDAIPKLNANFNQYIFSNVVSLKMGPGLLWYNSNFITLCNLILALNRFSAIIFPLKFLKFWSKRNTTIIIILLVLYPIIIHSFNLINVYYTIINVPRPKGVSTTDLEKNFLTLSDFFYSISATVAGITAALHMMTKGNMKDKSVEKSLLAQSLTSSIFLSLSTFTAWLGSVNSYNSTITNMAEIERVVALQAFLVSISKLCFSLHHYIGLSLLTTTSSSFRKAYLDFYRITFLFKRVQKLYKSDTTAVTVLHPSMAPPSTRNSGFFRGFSTQH